MKYYMIYSVLVLAFRYTDVWNLWVLYHDTVGGDPKSLVAQYRLEAWTGHKNTLMKNIPTQESLRYEYSDMTTHVHSFYILNKNFLISSYAWLHKITK